MVNSVMVGKVAHQHGKYCATNNRLDQQAGATSGERPPVLLQPA